MSLLSGTGPVFSMRMRALVKVGAVRALRADSVVFGVGQAGVHVHVRPGPRPSGRLVRLQGGRRGQLGSFLLNGFLGCLPVS